MISAPTRDFPIVDNQRLLENRFHGWLLQASALINQANHPGFSQIIDISRGDATLTYTKGVLTRVTYADASTKDFGYTDGILTSITDSAGSNLAFTFKDGALSEITLT